MHYKGYIITKEFPTNDILENILEKYRENDSDEIQPFSWDWYEIGGRYGGSLKIKFNPEENEDNYYCFRDRNNKYFISQILNEIKNNKENKYYDELDYLKYMGLREDILYVDGAYTKDIINFDITDCFAVINENEIYIRQSWNGNNFIENENFDKEVNNIDLTNKFITAIDFHD